MFVTSSVVFPLPNLVQVVLPASVTPLCFCFVIITCFSCSACEFGSVLYWHIAYANDLVWTECSFGMIIRPCLDPKILHQKTSHRMFGYIHRVLNKIYLQNFLHGWIVNHETNLMSLIIHRCKKFSK